MNVTNDPYSNCTLCPRKCGADRHIARGACGMGHLPVVNISMVHTGEEPVLSGDAGVGAVFFEGCPLRCIFCQNRAISAGGTGKGTALSPEGLSDLFFELKAKGVSAIDLVTPMHFAPSVAQAVRTAKDRGIGLPFIINCSGYDEVPALRLFEGLADIYLPDFKFWDTKLSSQLAGAPDYRQKAMDAVSEMVRQTGGPVLNEKGLMTRGTIVRHLMLPGQLFDTKKILEYLTGTYGNRIYISLMNQYTPTEYILKKDPVPAFLKRRLPESHYDAAVELLIQRGQENAFIQEGDASGSEMIPAFRY